VTEKSVGDEPRLKPVTLSRVADATTQTRGRVGARPRPRRGTFYAICKNFTGTALAAAESLLSKFWIALAAGVNPALQ